MSLFALLYNQSFEGEKEVCDIQNIPEKLKSTPEGLYRSPFLLNAEDPQTFDKFIGGMSIEHFGPLCLTFAVRRARDLLTEGCEYQGLQLELETGGRKLPQLPGPDELAKLLEKDDCLIYVNQNPYKPVTEVFGFQQVYDDSVRCMDALKKLGIPQETMAVFATPEEISIEIHPGIPGLQGSENLFKLYYRLLCNVAEIREVEGKALKTNVRTIILNCCKPDFKILIPGSTHPVLHRTKVGVGASHFAYGVAAFSDFCAKKRSLQECVQESLNWLKFIQTDLPPVAGLSDKIAALPDLPFPGFQSSVTATGKPVSKGFSGRFQPLSAELAGADECYKELPPAVKTISRGLDKALGGGFQKNGVHLIVGPVNSGKGCFLTQQALAAAKKSAVLYVSYEHGLKEFALRAAISGGNTSMSDLLSQIPAADNNGAAARKTLAAAIEKFRSDLPESFFFSGVENFRSELDTNELSELARMLPSDTERLVIIESLNDRLLGKNPAEKFFALKQIAVTEKLTFLISLHRNIECGKRPHFIDGSDNVLLEEFQGLTDSIIVCLSEKINLRRFVAMVKGQIDAQLVGKLEQKALQLSGNRRLKSDSYNLFRIIHTRHGRREIMLHLFQPDFVRFFEIASIQLNRG
jgi:hypothetical protein